MFRHILTAGLALAVFSAQADTSNTNNNYRVTTGQNVLGTVVLQSTDGINAKPVDASNPLQVTSSGGTVSTTPLAVTTTDKSGTITLGGTAQPAILLNASRKAYCVQNPPTATEVLTVRVNGTASATTGVILSAGSQACSLPGLIDTAAVSVFAATTAHAFTAWEAQ